MRSVQRVQCQLYGGGSDGKSGERPRGCFHGMFGAATQALKRFMPLLSKFPSQVPSSLNEPALLPHPRLSHTARPHRTQTNQPPTTLLPFTRSPRVTRWPSAICFVFTPHITSHHSLRLLFTHRFLPRARGVRSFSCYPALAFFWLIVFIKFVIDR